jgi:uncharacterized repeat protein (TIGR01451 family)
MYKPFNMKSHLLFTCIFYLFLNLAPQSLKAQWEELLLPSTSAARFANGGSRVYAIAKQVTNTPIYSSADGILWEQKNANPIQVFFTPDFYFAAQGDSVLLGYHNGFQDSMFVVYSVNQGKDWTLGNSYSTHPNPMMHFHEGRLFGITQNNTVQYSDDLGTSWAPVQNLPITNLGINSRQIVEHKGKLYFTEQIATISRSDNEGVQWNQVNTPAIPGTHIIENLISGPKHLFISVRDPVNLTRNWYRSADLGATWIPFTCVAEIGDVFEAGNRIYVNTSVGQHYSDDAGQTWSPVARNIAKITENILHDGKFVSHNEGRDWEPGMFGFANQLYGCFATAHQLYCETGNGVAITAIDSTLNYTWQNTSSFANPNNGVLREGDLRVYLQGSTFFYSFNDGKTWNQRTIGPDYYLLEMLNGTILFTIGGTNTIIYTTDFGQTFFPTNMQANPKALLKYNQHFLIVDQSNEFFAAPNSDPSVFQPANIPPATNGASFSKYYCLENHLFYYNLSYLFRYNGVSWDTCTFDGFQYVGSTLYSSIVQGNGGDLFMLCTGSLFATATLFTTTNAGLTWNNGGSQFPPVGHYKDLLKSDHYLYFSFNDEWQHLRIFRKPYTVKPQLQALGTVFLDENKNGLHDTGEPPYEALLVKSANTGYYGVSGPDGHFAVSFDNHTGSDMIIPLLNRPYYVVTTPPIVVHSTPGFNHAIGVTDTNPNITDLSIDLTSQHVFQPGFETTIIATFQNHGTIPAEGQFKLILDTLVQYLNTDELAPTVIMGDTICYQIPALNVNNQFVLHIRVRTLVSAPLDTAVYISGNIITTKVDSNLLNNFYAIQDTIVGSYDPNDKAVQPEVLYPDMVVDGKDIIYTIRFQNTGTFPATFVRILDTLDAHLNISSIRVVAASHAYHWTVRDRNVLDVFFDQINLPDSTANEPASHGFVKFAIKPNSTLQIGHRIHNTGHIYFDFNAPIATNTVTTEAKIVHTQDVKSEPFRFQISPNPGKDQFHITLNEPLNEPTILKIIDASGRICINQSYRQLPQRFELPRWQAAEGIYLVQMSTAKGTVSRKLCVGL